MELQKNPVDPRDIIRQLARMIAGNRLDPARHLLAAARSLAPEAPELVLLSVRLAIRQGRSVDALHELDAAIAADPLDAALFKARADLRSDMEDLPGAAQDAAEAVMLDRDDPEAKALLGVVLLELGQVADGGGCLAEAVAARPRNPFYRQGLARAQEAGGAHDEAAATLDAAIEANPARGDLRTGAVMLRLRQRDFAGALRLAEAACRDGLADACLFGLKGHALSSLERHDEAAEAYGEALKLGPDDPYVRHLVASAGMRPGAPRAPAEYLRAVFDGYAARFERHLIALGYRVPGLIRAALIRNFGLVPSNPAGTTARSVLDLGCGTGLMGVVLADLDLGPITGVDLSPGMLAEARAKGLYAELMEADILAMLAADRGSWPVILASDVLCYFGELSEVFTLVRRRLSAGGLFVFSVEASEAEAGWRLGPQGRYSHRRDHVEQAARAAGLHVRELVPETMRFEMNQPVAGLLAVLEAAPC